MILVSILIPAYNVRYVEAALVSALGQTYKNIEIVVSDDSCDDTIGAICERYADERIRHIKNKSNLGFSGNFTQCLNLARGELIKFLNDDDLLDPSCVERMVTAFEKHGATLTLVTSKRRIINAEGQPQPDTLDTSPLCAVDALLDGVDVGNLLLRHSINFVGEPTTVMFRKSALAWDDHDIFRWGDESYICLADVSLWLRLLHQGKAAYLADELSYFRVHPGQEQKKPAVAIRCITERYSILYQARQMGFLSNTADYVTALRAVMGIYQQALTASGISEPLRNELNQGLKTMRAEIAVSVA